MAGRREGSRGGSCSRHLLSWRAPISSLPKPAVTRFVMKSPDASPDDQVIRDRQKEDIAEDQGSLFQAFEAEDEVVRWSFPS